MLFCFAIFFIDRVSKILARNFKYKILNGINIIPNLLSLKYTENSGVSFGLFQEYKFLTVVLPIIFMIILYIMIKKHNDRCLLNIYLFLLGAFAGNLYDRISYSYVVDMIHFPFLPFFICNIADIAIFFAGILIVIKLISKEF